MIFRLVVEKVANGYLVYEKPDRDNVVTYNDMHVVEGIENYKALTDLLKRLFEAKDKD